MDKAVQNKFHLTLSFIIWFLVQSRQNQYLPCNHLYFQFQSATFLILDHIHNIKSFLIKTTKNILQLGFKRLAALPDSNWNKTISSHSTLILYLRKVQWLQPFGKKKAEMFQL